MICQKKFSKIFQKILASFIAVILLLSVFSPISAKADSWITNTNVGTTPFAITINETTNKIYVANRDSNDVSVIDGATNNVIATIPVGDYPRAIKVNSITNRIYVANYFSDTVSVINGATDTLLTTINTGINPKVLDINTITNKIYVANWSSSDVTIIDGATGATTTTAVSAGSDDIVVNDITNKIYMTIPGTGELGVIDGNTGNLIATIANAGSTYLGLNKTSNKLYSTAISNNLVKVSNGLTDTYIGSINTGGSALYKPAINEVANRIYITDPWVDKLFIIDGSTDTVLTSVNFISTDNPGSVTFNPISNKIYVTNYGSNTLAVIDAATNSIIQTLATGTLPAIIAINQTTGKIYVNNFSSANVSIYNGSIATPAPTITLLTPNSGPIGTPVTITGTNFGAIQGASTVRFNGTTSTATLWSDTSITVTVPAGATAGNVVVTTGSGASNGVLFTVTIPIPAPTITLLNPNSGPIGTSVIITGTNFGAVQGASTVKFNGTTATSITSWSDTQIIAIVPAGATTGNVVVTTGSGASNGVLFTVTVPPPNTAPYINTITASQQTDDGYVNITYTLKDDQSNTCSLVSYQYSLNNSTWVNMTPALADPDHEGVSGLSSSPAGVSHTFVWDALVNLGNIYDVSVWVRLKPNDGTADGAYTKSGSFAVDVKKPIISAVKASQILGTNNVKITYNLSDNNTTGLFVEIEISEDGGATWTVPSTSTSGAIGSGVTSGNGKIITWNAGVDFANQDQNDLKVRIRAKDKYQNQGNYVSSVNFKIDTKAPVGLASFTGISSTLNSITWSWTPVSLETNFKNYEIWYGTDLNDVLNRTGTAKVKTITSKTTSSTITTGLISGTLYYAKIWANDKYGNQSTITEASYFTKFVAPKITTLNPNSGFVGDTIIITGTNFGATQGTSAVKFSGTTATSITSWSATQIKANVPAGTTTGNVIVTTGGGTSNGILFTILTPTTNNVIATDYSIYKITANSSNDKIYLLLSDQKIAVVDYATNNIAYNNIGGLNSGESILGQDFKINSITNKIYAYFYNSSTKDRGVAVIDAGSLSITNRISGVSNMYNMVVDEKYNRIFVLNYNSVTIISGSSNTVIKTVYNVPPNENFAASNISFDPLKNKIYVLSDDSSSKSYLTVISGGTYAVTKRIPLSYVWPARDIVMDPSASKAYIINSKANNVIAINTSSDSVAKTILCGEYCYGVSVNETAGRTYIIGPSKIKIINRTTLADIATTDSFAGTSIASSPSANRTYIGKSGSKTHYMNNILGVIYGSANNSAVNAFTVNYDSSSINNLIAYKNKAYLTSNITQTGAPKKAYLVINE